MKKILFVLGASDVEMSEIQKGLTNLGIPYLFAGVVDPRSSKLRRVYANEAYKATSLLDAEGRETTVPEGAEVIAVECEVAGITPVAKCDHHRPGDRGYGRPPTDYLSASSIGQVVDLLSAPLRGTWDELEIVPAFGGLERLGLAAASDHCPAHAFKGMCPGIDLQALIRFRAEEKAAFQRCSVEEMYARISSAAEQVRNLPIIMVGGCEVRDATGQEIDQLPDGSLIAGLPVQYRLVDPKGEKPEKIGLLGGEPEVVNAWMESARTYLHDVYGDPARGYAGGYTQPQG